MKRIFFGAGFVVLASAANFISAVGRADVTGVYGDKVAYSEQLIAGETIVTFRALHEPVEGTEMAAIADLHMAHSCPIDFQQTAYDFSPKPQNGGPATDGVRTAMIRYKCLNEVAESHGGTGKFIDTICRVSAVESATVRDLCHPKLRFAKNRRHKNRV